MTNRIVQNLLVFALVIGILNSTRSQAQTPALPPHFEVASIRPNSIQDFEHCAGDGPSPGRLTSKCATLQSLIQQAYGAFGDGRMPIVPKTIPISGGPSWIGADHFDIDAKAEGNPPMEMMAGPMLQRLLEDRFKLKVHRETREMPVYALTVAKGGLKIQPLTEACTPLDMATVMAPPAPGQKRPNFCGSPGRPMIKGQTMTLNLRAMRMEDLSAYLSGNMDRSVIDKTGVNGIFDFQLEFAIDDTTRNFPGARAAVPSDDPGPSIFTAIQNLGLKLESTKGPVDFLIIDHVEKPSDN
jgi:uncharacterized protein (TIGR03435 family)